MAVMIHLELHKDPQLKEACSIVRNTVELLYPPGLGRALSALIIKLGVLISGIVLYTLVYTLYVAGTIRTGVLISGTLFYVAGIMHSVLIKGGVLISGVVLYTFLCV